MSKRTLFIFLSIAAIVIAVIAMLNINPEEKVIPEISDDFSQATVQPASPPLPSSYEIKLNGETLYLCSFDESGSELDRKTIEYIDIYSLMSSQLDALLSGARFDSREAAAEFIQDLDS